MSTEIWNIEKNLCRCCHTEGDFKSLEMPYLNDSDGREEIYTNMLRECLDLTIMPVSTPLYLITYAICDTCIMRLRDANNFKRQVIECEEKFKNMYSKDVITGPDSIYGAEVKTEPFSEGYRVYSSDDDDFALNFDNEDDKNNAISTISKTRKGKSKSHANEKKETSNTKSSSTKVKDESAEEKPAEKKKIIRSRFYLRDTDYKTEGEASYICVRCSRRYSKILSLKYHVKTKHYKIPRYVCPHCSKEFMTLAPLTIHKLEEHKIDDRFKCQACPCQFNTKVQLRKHKNNFHMLGEKYECDLCEYVTFSFEGANSRAKYYTVTADKQYSCNVCSKCYASQPLVSQHYRFVHLKRRPRERKCPKCDVRLPGYLRAYHLEEAHGIPAPACGVCGKKFRFPCHVLQHQKKVHMGEKTVACDICRKSFFSNISLRLHMSTHSSERKYKCEVCERQFRWENNLKDHLRIHAGDKRYVCGVCGKAFVQKSTLKQHATRNHPGLQIFDS